MFIGAFEKLQNTSEKLGDNVYAPNIRTPKYIKY